MKYQYYIYKPHDTKLDIYGIYRYNTIFEFNDNGTWRRSASNTFSGLEPITEEEAFAYLV